MNGGWSCRLWYAMPCEECVQRYVHVELELFVILSHNGSKTTVVPSWVCRMT